ncbi:MAG: hypothetical protein QM656_16070 [Paracoccaceae bacterium]
MRFVHFIHVGCPDANLALAPARLDTIRKILRATPSLKRGLFYLPSQARDYYTDDGPSPRLALQLYYDRLEDLEAAAAKDGYLQALTTPDLWTDLPEYEITHQAMYARPFPVRDPVYAPDEGTLPCAYLVHYPGAAEDFNAWLNHYLDHHPQIMKDFPRIREIEIYTRLGWREALPWKRVDFMQRNRLIFDGPAALEAALNGEVRHRMRADFEAFPPFTGANIHYPMFKEELLA